MDTTRFESALRFTRYVLTLDGFPSLAMLVIIILTLCVVVSTGFLLGFFRVLLVLTALTSSIAIFVLHTTFWPFGVMFALMAAVALCGPFKTTNVRSLYESPALRQKR